MDLGPRRFPSLVGISSTVSFDHGTSHDDQLSESSASRSLSRLSSPSSTRLQTLTTFTSYSLSRHGKNEIEPSKNGQAIDGDLPPQYSISIYASLSLPPGDYIRLLCIKPGLPGSPLDCVLFVASIADYKDRFIALSYVWGRDTNLAPIYVNGHVQALRRNLFTFICTLRSTHRDTIIWADAVCIDQQSHIEKNHQVKLMHKIYSAAACTRAWLGDSMPVIAQAMKYISGGDQGMYRAGSELKARDAQHLLLPLIRHEYWSRTWIIQEILLPKEVWVHCGEQSVCWADLIQLARSSANQPNGSRLLHIQALGECTMMHLHKMRHNTHSRGLPGLLRDYGSTVCEDVRDRVFGLIGLINDHNDPLYVNDAILFSNRARDVIDYASSPKELFFQLVRLYQPLPVHHFAIPLWTALQLDDCHLNAYEFGQTLQVQGFPSSRLTMARSHVRPLNRAASVMNLDDTTQEELLSFLSPNHTVDMRCSRVSLAMRVRIDDFRLSGCYLASKCFIEPRGLVIERQGYDLLCQAFDGTKVHKWIQDQRQDGAWVMTITIAALKALSCITKPADNQRFHDSIQAEHFDREGTDADILEWIISVRQHPDVPMKSPWSGNDRNTLHSKSMVKNLLPTMPPNYRDYTAAPQDQEQQQMEPTVLVDTNEHHEAKKRNHFTRLSSRLRKSLHRDAQPVYF